MNPPDLFCSECMVALVETAVFANGKLGTDKRTKRPAHEILCCHESGCQSGFQDSILQKILSEKTWEKYSEMQANAVIALAGLGDTLGTCPKCGYQAFLPETEMIFACPVEDCRFASCRKCGQVAHIPLRCEEVVRKKRQAEGRLKVEEALSDAKIRICPKCKKKSIKSEGCNKIQCPCGMIFCYVCRARIDQVGYEHFCRVPHCDHSACGQCKLFSNDQEDDDQAMKEAGITALERFKAEIRQKEGANTNEPVVDVQIDLNQMLHDPSRQPCRQQQGH
jgi:TRIAD3 protein (E3 ubiquitin-protein ligase RNF216)